MKKALSDMNKELYLIGGTMGVGKTTVCRCLQEKLPHSVFLDGDWCWDARPFCVTEETKKMVVENICFLLNNFLRCSAYENVIFCWVMHEQSIINDILHRLHLENVEVKTFSLLCTEEELTKRLFADIRQGKRTEEIIKRSVERMPLYQKLDTIKIDTTACEPILVAEKILQIARK